MVNPATITALLELCYVHKPWLLTYLAQDGDHRFYRFQTREDAECIAGQLKGKFSISNVPWTVRIWHRNGQVTDAHYPNIEEADMRAGIERGGNNTLDVRIFRA